MIEKNQDLVSFSFSSSFFSSVFASTKLFYKKCHLLPQYISKHHDFRDGNLVLHIQELSRYKNICGKPHWLFAIAFHHLSLSWAILQLFPLFQVIAGLPASFQGYSLTNFANLMTVLAQYQNKREHTTLHQPSLSISLMIEEWDKDKIIRTCWKKINY